MSLTLNQLRRELEVSPRAAIMGVGQALQQDDAAGLLLAQALRPFASDTVLVVEAGHAPENCAGLINRFAPHLLIVVDTAYLAETPGAVQVLDWREASGVSASTHTLPLRMVLQYVTAVTGCRVLLLGIQPQQVGVGTAVSEPVRQTIEQMVAYLGDLLEKLPAGG